MHTILTVIPLLEAFVFGLIIGHAAGFSRTKHLKNEMDELIGLFNDSLEMVYQQTGVELPKLPTLKEIENGRHN